MSSTAAAHPAAAVAPASPSRLARDSVVDALRSLAIVMMAMSHTARIIDKDVRPLWGEWILIFDPWPQCLFLGLVGASLVLSLDAHRKRGTPGSWALGRLKRAGELYLLSMLLFFFDRGLQCPDLFTASGILADIALAVVIFTPVAQLERPLLGATALTGLLLAFSLWLHGSGAEIFWINTANAPIFPNIVWTGIGLVAFQALHEGRRGILALLAGLSVLLSGLLLTRHGFVELLTTPVGRDEAKTFYLGRSHGLGNTWDLIRGEELRRRGVTYFNPTVLSMPISALLTTGSYLLFRAVEPALDKVRSNVLLIGRYSLGVYVFHLLVLVIPVMIAGKSRPLESSAAAWGFMAGLLALCWGYAFVRHGMVKRKRARQAAAAADPRA